jgi:hypothetical protein
MPGSGRLPNSASFDPGALEFSLLDLQQQQQRDRDQLQQQQQQQQQEQQLVGGQPPPPHHQLPFIEYHDGVGGGLMDAGQLAMQNLSMYRQQPPQPPRMRRGLPCPVPAWRRRSVGLSWDIPRRLKPT